MTLLHGPALALALLHLETPSAASEPTDPPPINLDATLGIGSPVGWLGVGASIRPIDLLAISAGAGLGSHGTQWAGMVSVYPLALQDRMRLGFGAGISTGTFVTSTFKNAAADLYWDRYFERAWFLNLQASLPVWTTAGFGVEPFAGYGFVLNENDGACSTWRSDCKHVTGVAFVGVTVRFGFWL